MKNTTVIQLGPNFTSHEKFCIMGFLASFSVDTTQPHLSSVLVILIGLDDPGERGMSATRCCLLNHLSSSQALLLNKVLTLMQF